MKIQVLIVEDDPLTSLDLKEALTDEGMDVIGVARSVDEAKKLIEKHPPDTLLVDINLEGDLDGIELVQSLSFPIPVVYLTANSDEQTVKRAMETSPGSFLTKPYDERDVFIALELAFQNHNKLSLNKPSKSERSFLFLKSGNRFEKVNMADINYLKAEGSYTKFVTLGKEYVLSSNLNTVSSKIDSGSFMRIHRSYVVNLDNVTGLDNDYVFFGEENIPMSRNYKEEVGKILRRIS